MPGSRGRGRSVAKRGRRAVPDPDRPLPLPPDDTLSQDHHDEALPDPQASAPSALHELRRFQSQAERQDVLKIRHAPSCYRRAIELSALACTPRKGNGETLAFMIHHGARRLAALDSIKTISAARRRALRLGAGDELQRLESGCFRVVGDATDATTNLIGRVPEADRAVAGDVARALGLSLDPVALVAIAITLIDCGEATPADQERLVAIVRGFAKWLKTRVTLARKIEASLAEARGPRVVGRPQPRTSMLLRGL